MRSRSFFVLFLGLFLLGCGSKLNQSSFARVKRNMSEVEVQELLGPGTAMTDDEMLAVLKRGYDTAPEDMRKSAEKLTTQSVQSYTGWIWREGKKSIVVLFRDGRVNQSHKDGF